MIRRPPRSTHCISSAASDVYKRQILESAEILIKYSGYIDREKLVADKYKRLENIIITGKFDFSKIATISTEARQKLAEIQPDTIGQASRISGVSPSDINVLLVLMGRQCSTWNAQKNDYGIKRICADD
eukprot:TRINITY_DN27831_c0_g1_i2.p3 TRINITY_DN27831_c0_g1~~TRINITY_DN27831_c0_g1_i2.p3  ORF type:complete len:129 (-),score=17.94 TRINITY_DN27831_c0_g1_i2:204-590(-)